MLRLEQDLAAIAAQGNYRSLAGAKPGLDFASNDYLGFSTNSEIRQALIAALEATCPLGATGSRLLGGQTEFHERAENFLADCFDVDSALLFSSGFMANLAVLSTLGGADSEFFSDELNHASLIDGMRLSKSRRAVFRHNDLNHLEELLRSSRSSRKIIVSESVFSMDGDLAPLPHLIALAKQYAAWLVIDEAHATGVFGRRGLGRLEDYAAEGAQLVTVHTGGKALGAQGAFVLSTKLFREYMINQARPFIFSTALSPLNAYQIETAMRLLLRSPRIGQELLAKAQEFREETRAFCDFGKSESQIVPILLGSNEKTLRAAEYLQERGCDVRAIRSPTVARGSERLRITLKSFHSREDMCKLVQTLREALCDA